jgi:phosphopantothenoylcysteine decarboxylase/phosphopantothenate--cysteine ligase
MSQSKILFQLSGSIAAYKACFAISRLVQDGYELQCVATKGALEFVGAATIEGLTGKPVFTDLYESGRMMDHIHLSKWADLAIVCPASANTINRLAAGLSDDVIGALFLSFDLKKPYLVAPAMNQQMFKHPATQSSLAKLESFGVKILPTGEGHQACGDVGEGRLLEPEAIVKWIGKCLG